MSAMKKTTMRVRPGLGGAGAAYFCATSIAELSSVLSASNVAPVGMTTNFIDSP